MIRMPVLDLGKCNYCGLCVSVCYCNVLVVIDEVLTARDLTILKGCEGKSSTQAVKEEEVLEPA